MGRGMQERVEEEADGCAAEESEEQTGRFRHLVHYARMHDRLDDGNGKRCNRNPEEPSAGGRTEGPDRCDREPDIPRRAPSTKRERAVKYPQGAGRELMTNRVDESIPAFAIGKPHHMLKDRSAEGDNYKTGSEQGEEKPHAHVDGTA